VTTIAGLKQQKIWRNAAVMNFTFGSAAAGFYVFTALHFFLSAALLGQVQLVVNTFVAIALMGIGFGLLALETGASWKTRYSVLNIRTSWMSREVLAGGIFLFFSAAGLIFPVWWTIGIAALAAFAFIVTQAMIIYRSRAIVTWNTPPVIWLFVFSGLISGYGVFIVMMGPAYAEVVKLPVMAAALMAYGSFWWYYAFLYRAGDPSFRAATEYLRHKLSIGVILGAGVIFPVIGLLFVENFSGPLGDEVLIVVAGAGMVYGVFQRNRDLIIKAGYMRKMTMRSPG
jgi:hypothetical protein